MLATILCKRNPTHSPQSSPSDPRLLRAILQAPYQRTLRSLRVRCDDPNAPPTVISWGFLGEASYPLTILLLQALMIEEIVRPQLHNNVLWGEWGPTSVPSRTVAASVLQGNPLFFLLHQIYLSQANKGVWSVFIKSQTRHTPIMLLKTYLFVNHFSFSKYWTQKFESSSEGLVNHHVREPRSR